MKFGTNPEQRMGNTLQFFSDLFCDSPRRQIVAPFPHKPPIDNQLRSLIKYKISRGSEVDENLLGGCRQCGVGTEFFFQHKFAYYHGRTRCGNSGRGGRAGARRRGRIGRAERAHRPVPGGADPPAGAGRRERIGRAERAHQPVTGGEGASAPGGEGASAPGRRAT